MERPPIGKSGDEQRRAAAPLPAAVAYGECFALISEAS
jgi:hypothetical protein